jgi:anti-sigma-K factor RskA
MTDDDDIDGLAAEYVVGSLDPAERAQVAARCRTDVALREAIKDWERRLGTLADGVPGIEPPVHLYSTIANRLWGQGDDSIEIAEVTPLRRSARRWRGLAVGAGALAACLALIVVWLFQNSPGAPTTFVAELRRSAAGPTADESAKSPGPPGFVVSLDLAAHTIKITPVAVRPTPRRSYQLWLTEGGSAAPSSLGVVSQSEPTTSAWRRLATAADLVNATLSVSLEPDGGSPTGLPSGPIVFIGKLVPVATP